VVVVVVVVAAVVVFRMRILQCTGSRVLAIHTSVCYNFRWPECSVRNAV
jgi:hypothetical protein